MARTDYYNDPHAPQPNSIVVAVTAYVVNSEGDLLLIRRTDNDRYAIPGGALELGETLTQAVVRETKEETGVDVEVAGIIGIYSDPAHVIEFTDGEVRQEFSICFRATPVDGQIRTSDESKEVIWVNPARIDELSIHPSIRLRIQHGIHGDDSPYYT
ncbi:NUDIX hydrolase [Actinokineospora spheciospongiae]|uniref:NUDIX hydrolase n=1 Tax=Actinokineospora spheciospongiae TaxID=909613 RepID=UPI000D718478|nr:NUDIX domain-containing protein [Actinokineospora spheciospongiae]